MKEVAPGLFLLSGFPPGGFNVYLLQSEGETVLVDTSTRHARRRILRQLPDRIDAILITHAHRDHAGAMHAVAEATGSPVWASAADAPAIEGKAPEPAPEQYRDHIVNRAFAGWWRDRHPVARRLAEGERVAGFEVVWFPGHTPGMIGLWRESDRTVICADVMRGMNLVTGLPQLGEMPKIFTSDLRGSRGSIQKLAGLEAGTVCFGHGRPLTKDAAAKINEFAAKLPSE